MSSSSSSHNVTDCISNWLLTRIEKKEFFSVDLQTIHSMIVWNGCKRCALDPEGKNLQILKCKIFRKLGLSEADSDVLSKMGEGSLPGFRLQLNSKISDCCYACRSKSSFSLFRSCRNFHFVCSHCFLHTGPRCEICKLAWNKFFVHFGPEPKIKKRQRKRRVKHTSPQKEDASDKESRISISDFPVDSQDSDEYGLLRLASNSSSSKSVSSANGSENRKSKLANSANRSADTTNFPTINSNCATSPGSAPSEFSDL